MNHVMPVSSEADSLPFALELPAISLALQILIDRLRHDKAPPSCLGELRNEAAAALPIYEAACQPVPQHLVGAWLHTINYASSAPVGRGEFAIRAAAIAKALSNMPVGVFTCETSYRAAGAWKFFPGAFEIKEFLGPSTGKLFHTRHALRVIGKLPETKPPEPLPTPAEREAVLKEFHKALAAMLPGWRRPDTISSSQDQDGIR